MIDVRCMRRVGSRCLRASTILASPFFFSSFLATWEKNPIKNYTRKPLSLIDHRSSTRRWITSSVFRTSKGNLPSCTAYICQNACTFWFPSFDWNRSRCQSIFSEDPRPKTRWGKPNEVWGLWWGLGWERPGAGDDAVGATRHVLEHRGQRIAAAGGPAAVVGGLRKIMRGRRKPSTSWSISSSYTWYK